MVCDSKTKFNDKIADKLRSETLSATKDWWSTLKTVIFPNSKTFIPALESNRIIYTNDRDKANALNNFFQSQTILDEQNAILPEFYPSVTTTELTSIVLTSFEVESVLKSLSIGKASGPNGTSNRILRELSSKLSIPFCSQVIQPLINLLSCIIPFVKLSLDSGKEVRAVICDISKAFDRVWHVGLLHKLRVAGVTGEVLAWFKSYLINRKQRVVLPGAVSDWTSICAGIPQGSILGPLPFLFYIPYLYAKISPLSLCKIIK